jgi:serine/threonine-protein kinase
MKGRQYLKTILRDGETALLDSELQTTTGSILKIALKPGAQATPVVSSPQFNHFAANVSSDGRWLAYQSNESGRPEIYVQDFAEGGGRFQISTSGGQEPHWSPDGRELYYRNSGSLMAVPIETKTSFQAGTPKNLFGEVYDLRSNSGETYDVDPRGGRFLLMRPPKEEVSSAQVRMVLNWFTELQRLVPVR